MFNYEYYTDTNFLENTDIPIIGLPLETNLVLLEMA